MTPYRRLALDQGTREWHAFRATIIGASDAPTIMGENPWKSVDALLAEKRGTKKQFRGNALTRMGAELEPHARSLYQAQRQIMVRPAVLHSSVYEWQGASLDGIDDAGTVVVEIKCGKKAYEHVQKKRQVPKYYYAQLQHILSVTGLPIIDYFTFWPDEAPILIAVPRDQAYIERMIAAEEEFWREVSGQTRASTKRTVTAPPEVISPADARRLLLEKIDSVIAANVAAFKRENARILGRQDHRAEIAEIVSLDVRLQELSAGRDQLAEAMRKLKGKSDVQTIAGMWAMLGVGLATGGLGLLAGVAGLLGLQQHQKVTKADLESGYRKLTAEMEEIARHKDQLRNRMAEAPREVPRDLSDLRGVARLLRQKDGNMSPGLFVEIYDPLQSTLCPPVAKLVALHVTKRLTMPDAVAAQLDETSIDDLRLTLFGTTESADFKPYESLQVSNELVGSRDIPETLRTFARERQIPYITALGMTL